jgi:hypothetical protein
MKLWSIHTFIGMEIIQLQKMVNLVTLHLETQADTAFHVCKCSSQRGRRDAIIEVAQTGQADSGSWLLRASSE